MWTKSSRPLCRSTTRKSVLVSRQAQRFFTLTRVPSIGTMKRSFSLIRYGFGWLRLLTDLPPQKTRCSTLLKARQVTRLWCSAERICRQLRVRMSQSFMHSRQSIEIRLGEGSENLQPTTLWTWPVILAIRPWVRLIWGHHTLILVEKFQLTRKCPQLSQKSNPATPLNSSAGSQSSASFSQEKGSQRRIRPSIPALQMQWGCLISSTWLTLFLCPVIITLKAESLGAASRMLPSRAAAAHIPFCSHHTPSSTTELLVSYFFLRVSVATTISFLFEVVIASQLCGLTQMQSTCSSREYLPWTAPSSGPQISTCLAFSSLAYILLVAQSTQSWARGLGCLVQSLQTGSNQNLIPFSEQALESSSSGEVLRLESACLAMLTMTPKSRKLSQDTLLSPFRSISSNILVSPIISSYLLSWKQSIDRSSSQRKDFKFIPRSSSRNSRSNASQFPDSSRISNCLEVNSSLSSLCRSGFSSRTLSTWGRVRLSLLIHESISYARESPMSSPQNISVTAAIIMYLDKRTHDWLVSSKVIPQNSARPTAQGLLLSEELALAFELGSLVARAISDKYAGNKAVSQPLGNIKSGNTQAAKIYNWTAIWNSLKQANMEFEDQFKSLVLSGDRELIAQLLRTVEDKNPLEASIGPSTKDIQQEEDRRRKALQPFDASKLQSKKNLSECNNTLEFLIFGLSRRLTLPVKQVIGLFTNQNKYLAHLLAKGFKGEFGQLLGFFSDVQSNVRHLATLFSYDQSGKSTQLTLQALKPGFVSKNQDIVRACCSLFIRVSKEITVVNKQNPKVRKQFMLGEARGLLTLVLGAHRHPVLGAEFAAVIKEYCGGIYRQVLQQSIRELVENNLQYYVVMCSILRPAAQYPEIESSVGEQTVEKWVQMAKASLDSKEQKSAQRYWAFNFLCQVWLAFPDVLDASLTERVLAEGWQRKNQGQFYNCVAAVFQLIEVFAKEKHVAAQSAYKVICGVLRSQLRNEDYRTYILQNLIPTFERYPQMPIDDTIMPFVNLTNQGLLFQTTDIVFVQAVSKLTKLLPQTAVHLSEALVRNLVDNVVFGAQLESAVKALVQRFVEERVVVQSCVKLSKFLLAFIYSGDKAKKPKEQHLPAYNGRKPSEKKLPVHELQVQIILSQKRARMISLLKAFIGLGSEELCERLKPLIAQTNLQLKNYHKNAKGHKGLYMLLGMLGNTKEIMEEAEVKDRESKLKQMGMEPSMQDSEHNQQTKKYIQAAHHPGVTQNLLQIKQNLEIVKVKKEEEEKQKAELASRKKEKTAKDLVTREIMLGLGRTKDNEVNLLREFGGWEKDVAAQELEPQPIQPDLLEDRDLEHVEVVTRKYQKGFKWLFAKYANSGHAVNSKAGDGQSVFDKMMERTELLSGAECTRLVKEVGLNDFITKEQNLTLLRNFNLKILKKREANELDYYSFEKYLFQLAIFTTTCPRRNLLSASPGQQLEVFCQGLRDSLAARKENTSLFDSPDTAYFKESDLIEEFNRRLREDQDYALPEGYRKVYQKEVRLDYEFNDAVFADEESYTVSLQVLNDILFDNFGERSAQARLVKSTVVKAKPGLLVKPPKLLEKGSVKFDRKQPDNLSQSGSRYGKPASVEKRRSEASAAVGEKVNLTLGMKLGLTAIGPRNRRVGEEVAFVLEKVIRAVEEGRDEPVFKVENEVMKQRRMQEEEQQRRQAERVEKLKDRKQQLKRQMKEYESKRRKEEQDTKEDKEKEKQRQQERERAKKEQAEKYIQDQKAKLGEKRQKEQEQKKLKEAEEEEARRKEQENKKRKFQEFNSKRLKEYSSRQEEERKQAENKQKEEELKRQQQEQHRKKMISKIAKTSEKTKQQEREVNEKIFDLHSSEGVQQLYRQTFRKEIGFLWDFLSRISFKLSKEHPVVNRDTFKLFGKYFKLAPGIMRSREILFVFNSLTKKKSGAAVGLDEGELEQALTRLAIKGKQVFNEFAKVIATRQLGEKEANEIITKEGEKNEFEEEKEEVVEDKDERIADHYGDLSKASAATVKGLLYYLRIPQDKASADRYFSQLQEGAGNIVLPGNKKEMREKFREDISELVKKKVARKEQ